MEELSSISTNARRDRRRANIYTISQPCETISLSSQDLEILPRASRIISFPNIALLQAKSIHERSSSSGGGGETGRKNNINSKPPETVLPSSHEPEALLRIRRNVFHQEHCSAPGKIGPRKRQQKRRRGHKQRVAGNEWNSHF